MYVATEENITLHWNHINLRIQTRSSAAYVSGIHHFKTMLIYNKTSYPLINVWTARIHWIPSNMKFSVWSVNLQLIVTMEKNTQKLTHSSSVILNRFLLLFSINNVRIFTSYISLSLPPSFLSFFFLSLFIYLLERITFYSRQVCSKQYNWCPPVKANIHKRYIRKFSQA